MSESPKKPKTKGEILLEAYWVKRTSSPFDEMTKHHLQYAIDAIDEGISQERSRILGLIEEEKTKWDNIRKDANFTGEFICNMIESSFNDLKTKIQEGNNIDLSFKE